MGLKTIFQEGMKERRRRKSLRSEKNEFKNKEKSHAGLLTALGRKAWEAQVDISAFADLKTALGSGQKNLDDLRSQIEKLQKQKHESETARKQANDRFNSSQKEMADKKRDVDRRWNEQKNELQALQKEVAQATGRLAAIAAEKARLSAKAADTATAEAEKSQSAEQLISLAKEEEELKNRIKEKEECSQPLQGRMAPLHEEAGRLLKQIDSLRAEQKKTLSELDQQIASLDKEMAGAKNKTAEAEQTQDLNFSRLGEKLAAAKSQDPSLAKEIHAAQTIKTEMEGIQALMGGLERQKDEAQVSAYKKMMAIVVGGIILIAAIIVLLIMLLSPG